MRILLTFLLFISIAPREASADPCEGLKPRLNSLAQRLSRGDIPGADRALIELRSGQPDCPEFVLDLARLQFAKGDEGADETFLRYTARKPKDSQGWSYGARFLLMQGAYQRADAASSLATDIDPDNPVVMAVRGQILSMKGQSTEAIELLQKSIELDPNDEEEIGR